jgi:glycosyltransferase involved in cell wall biosynthesis
MKVAWVTAYDAEDPRSYGTRGYYEPRSLIQQSVQVDYIGPLRIPWHYRPALYVKSRLNGNRFNGRWYSVERSPLVLRDQARQISRQLSKRTGIDIVCSGPSPWSQPVAYLESEQPIVIWTDGVFASVLDFYPEFFRNRISQASIDEGIANERAALSRCSLLIYASEWAAQQAMRHYGVDPKRIKIVPWGPNFECENTQEDVERIVRARPTDRCKLLFFGVDWKRKRGDLALDIARDLNRAGLRTELTVVGDAPPLKDRVPASVRFLNPIDKTTPNGLMQLFQLLAESHFLLLPTIADASPYALPEACAFGLPCLTTDVGGIPTMIRDGLNGRMFDVRAGSEQYCTFIADLFADYARYMDLARSSFSEYESRLNWGVAGRTVKNHLVELIS